MILVTLGTQDKEFTRLLKAIEKLIEKKVINDKVIVQAGYTNYQSSCMEIFDMTSKEELEALMKKADLIITHGGVGSILGALAYQKKVIAVPRLKKYKEHTNDHQRQIVKKFEECSYILAAKDLSKLDKVIEKSKTFKPKKYQSNRDNFVQLVGQYIKDTNHVSWYHRDYQMIIVSFLNMLTFSVVTLAFSFPVWMGLLVSYILSVFMILLLKFKRSVRIFVLLACFYIIDFICLMFFQKIHFSFVVGKILLSFIMVFIYHVLDKKS